MDYTYKDGAVILRGIDSFDISSILECGQCFRFRKLGENDYEIIARERILRIRQGRDTLEFFAPPEDYEDIWTDYFDLKRDYSEMKARLAAKGDIMRAAVEFSPGIRHLRQEPFETLISFIISQNRNIPSIMKSVELISRRFGSEIRDGRFAFPTPEQLSFADIPALMECKVGFRARYIADAVRRVLAGEIELSRDTQLSTVCLRDNLKKIIGVGDKVADCVMLFAYGRSEVFPTDVWIIRAAGELFFAGKQPSLKEIHCFAEENFGLDAGMANQYIFNYMRTRER